MCVPTTDHLYNISNNLTKKQSAWNWPADIWVLIKGPVPDCWTGGGWQRAQADTQRQWDRNSECTNTEQSHRNKMSEWRKASQGGRAEGTYRPPLPSTSAVTAIKPSGGEERGRLCRKSGVRPAAVSATKLGAPLQRIERELLWWERNLSLLECSVGLPCLTLLDNSLEPSRGREVWREDKRVEL